MYHLRNNTQFIVEELIQDIIALAVLRERCDSFSLLLYSSQSFTLLTVEHDRTLRTCNLK